MRRLKNTATAPRQLGTSLAVRTACYGNLLDEADNRHTLVHTRELYKERIHVSTSFNPASLNCSNCPNSPHNILEGQVGNSKPCAFILSDQCFPAALPSSSSGDCLAIIRIEDGTLSELTSTFLKLTSGCNLPVGSVVILASINHLGRVRSAAYAEDLVDAMGTIKRTFGGQIRILHGYPLSNVDIEDQVTIRGLMEIEAWLTSTSTPGGCTPLGRPASTSVTSYPPPTAQQTKLASYLSL